MIFSEYQDFLLSYPDKINLHIVTLYLLLNYKNKKVIESVIFLCLLPSDGWPILLDWQNYLLNFSLREYDIFFNLKLFSPKSPRRHLGYLSPSAHPPSWHWRQEMQTYSNGPIILWSVGMGSKGKGSCFPIPGLPGLLFLVLSWSDYVNNKIILKSRKLCSKQHFGSVNIRP